jgi:MFS transporter, ACS family, tartrate transporter
MSEPATGIDRFGDRWMKIVWRKPPPDIAERTRRRVTLHLLPYLFFLYILAYLDRVNVAVAQLGMELPPEQNGLGFSRSVIGFGAGLFFFGYWILEIPSTLSVVKWGARWVFVRVLVLWGLCATLVGFIGLPVAHYLFNWIPHVPDNWLGISGAAEFVNGLRDQPEHQFYFFRFMLGFFEGGFFPSVIMYLSLWFRPQDRAKAIALFMVAIPLSSAIGLPISSVLLGVNWFGLPGWRWIFIIQGIVPIFAGFATIFFLPDRPKKATWLAPEERAWLEGELDAEHRAKQGQGHWAWIHHAGMVLLLTGVYFGLNGPSSGWSTFMPAIIKSQSGVSSQVAGLLATVPYLVAFIAMLLNGWHSDRTKERIFHVATPLAFLGVSLLVASMFDRQPLVAAAIMMVPVGMCLYTHLPAFWPIPTMFLGAAAAASAIGFINMLGNLGGFYGPKMVGATVDQDIKWIDTLTIEKPPTPISKEAVERIEKLKESITASGKLPAEETTQVQTLLGQVETGVIIGTAQQRELVRLLNKGASFSDALRKLAIWPIMSSIIIVIVGYFRRRAPVRN